MWSVPRYYEQDSRKQRGRYKMLKHGGGQAYDLSRD
jgi:hypothetical protein